MIEETDNDDLYNDAVQIVFAHGKPSASLLQRRLRIGYGRAIYLLDRMQNQGLIDSVVGKIRKLAR